MYSLLIPPSNLKVVHKLECTLMLHPSSGESTGEVLTFGNYVNAFDFETNIISVSVSKCMDKVTKLAYSCMSCEFAAFEIYNARIAKLNIQQALYIAPPLTLTNIAEDWVHFCTTTLMLLVLIQFIVDCWKNIHVNKSLNMMQHR